MAEALKGDAEIYLKATIALPLTIIGNGDFTMDIWALGADLTKNVIGLITQSFLTIRKKRSSD